MCSPTQLSILLLFDLPCLHRCCAIVVERSDDASHMQQNSNSLVVFCRSGTTWMKKERHCGTVPMTMSRSEHQTCDLLAAAFHLSFFGVFDQARQRVNFSFRQRVQTSSLKLLKFLIPNFVCSARVASLASISPVRRPTLRALQHVTDWELACPLVATHCFLLMPPLKASDDDPFGRCCSSA